MERILVTGAAGFIGSHLAEYCLTAGHHVRGIDALKDYYPPSVKRGNIAAMAGHDRWEFVEDDLNEVDLGTLLADIDVVFHLAAQPGVRTSWGETFDAYVESNVSALQRLLEAARTSSIDRFVFASSSSVYGDAETFPTPESTPLSPVSPYGATKALGEHLCRIYHRSFDVPVVMLRYFTVYGPRQRPDMAFQRLITAALTDSEIRINGDGEQTRDFTFVADAVSGTFAAARSGVPGAVYNLGGGSRTSMNEVLRLIAAHIGQRLRVLHVPAQPGDARDTAADTALAREHLGYAPSRTLSEGLREQINWNQAGTGGPPEAAQPAGSRVAS